MAEEKVASTSSGVSRRKMIKGAAAAALVSGLMVGQEKPNGKTQKPCEQDSATKRKTTTQKCDASVADHTGMLGVWLALIRDGRYCDKGVQTGNKLGTWNCSVDAGDLAALLIKDMLPSVKKGTKKYTASLDSITQLIKQLRTPLPTPHPTTYELLYAIAADDLGGLSTGPYGGIDCPKLYTTVQSVATVSE